ncbi:heme oxygenase (biliverdin-producing) [Arthrobacter woluwensis]|uniref:biliverdin-producing heme oxygenase n=1 Tax=Arthrobacter woluwensis TaxID=156980 RepID=UPI001AAF7D40|nr:biliverdin-producing heme oxygenase [Arthrobacter woluwensis]QTF71655.1 biliverdin-producing heme oxygenase [Arthrobacter woluwensis]
MNAESLTFSARLRQATRVDHTEAESSEFITSLMEGARSGADYVLLLAQYRPLYEALESATARWRREPSVAELFDPALDRLAALDSDLPRLAEWAGLAEIPAVVPTAESYARRIAETGALEDPARLVAHHYLRYLGDLSGGQAIGTLVARHYGVPAGMLSMWEFPAVPKPKPYKDRYRELLDAFAVGHSGDAVVEEAALGFRLNREVFGELSRLSPHLATA